MSIYGIPHTFGHTLHHKNVFFDDDDCDDKDFSVYEEKKQQ
jgi:hypothetical protein